MDGTVGLIQLIIVEVHPPCPSQLSWLVLHKTVLQRGKQSLWLPGSFLDSKVAKSLPPEIWDQWEQTNVHPVDGL